jgi:hypothetical protein
VAWCEHVYRRGIALDLQFHASVLAVALGEQEGANELHCSRSIPANSGSHTKNPGSEDRQVDPPRIYESLERVLTLADIARDNQESDYECCQHYE